ncbi:MAG: NADH-quinone oxidoreductase subunit N [Anaerolineae bacterium]
MLDAQNFVLFIPETILVVGGIVVLFMDMFSRRRQGTHTWLIWPTLVVLALTLVAAAFQVNAMASIFPISDAPNAPGMYAVDPFTAFFRVFAVLATAMVLVASVGYIRGRTAYRGEFFALMIFATLSIILMAGATDLIMMILALEFLSIVSYILTGYLRGNPRSNEGAVKYFLYGSITTAITFYGASLLYGLTGTTNLYQIGEYFSNPAHLAGSNVMALVLPAIIFLLAGFGFKVALVPFHQWSPDAYEGAPTPVTAFMSVGPKAAGLAMLLRVFVTGLPEFTPRWAAIMIGVAAVTMTLGNLAALGQNNMKRLLAYSSIAQAGYMAIGIAAISIPAIAGVGPGEGGAGSPMDGTAGVLLYLIGYLFTNLGLFTIVIAMDYIGGSEVIGGYAGMLRRSPFVAIAMTIFFLSLIGIPPTAGFIGKLWVFGAAVGDKLFALAIIGAINGVISVVYYFKVVKQMYFVPAKDDAPLRLPLGINAMLGVCLALVLIIGIFPTPFINWANQSIQMVGVLAWLR